MSISDTDYIYASARIRAAEGSASPRERIERMLESKSVGELFSRINGSEMGEAVNNAGLDEIDEATESMIRDAAKMMLSAVPEPTLLHFLLYKYDCTNLKIAIKCHIRNLSETETKKSLYDFATVSVSDTITAVSERKFEIFSANIAQAAISALEEYAKTSDPRSIDFIMDRACFSDMVAGAANVGEKFFIQYVSANADITNMLIFDRISKMNGSLSVRQSLLKRALVNGGELSIDSFISALENKREGLRGILSCSRYYTLIEAFMDTIEPTDSERVCENFIIAPMSNVKYKAFGIEIPASYFITKEYEAKNIRIIAAKLISGKSTSDKIREAVRIGYA